MEHYEGSGPVEEATRRDVEALGEANSALGQVAIKLAVALDGKVTMATAAVAKELRATLEALREKDGDEPDDALTRLLAGLSAPVRN